MDTAVLAAMVSGVVALVAAAVTYVLTKKRDREAEWRKLKLDYYRELVAAISGIVGRRSTPPAQARFADALNNLILVAPKEVILKLYAFWDEIREKELDKTRHDELLSDLIRAIRRDIQPGRLGIDDALLFRLMDVPPE